MPGIVSHLGRAARAATRRALWLAIGGAFAAIALAFLTAALWMLLVHHQGALAATAEVGGLYAVAAAICLLLGSRGGRAEHDARAADEAFRRQPLVQLAEGFAMGMKAGRAARRERD